MLSQPPAARKVPLKHFTPYRPELEGTVFDASVRPILTGVARGLANLFPPVLGDGDEAGRMSEPGTSEDQRANLPVAPEQVRS